MWWQVFINITIPEVKYVEFENIICVTAPVRSPYRAAYDFHGWPIPAGEMAWSGHFHSRKSTRFYDIISGTFVSSRNKHVTSWRGTVGVKTLIVSRLSGSNVPTQWPLFIIIALCSSPKQTWSIMVANPGIKTGPDKRIIHWQFKQRTCLRCLI